MGGMFWQLVNICRGDRNVTSDAEGVLCVASPEMENCLALRDASEGPTWVGFRLFGYEERNRNRTQVLNLAAFKVNSTSSEATPKTTAPGTATGLEGVAASTTTLAATTTGAGGQAATTTTGSSLAAARLNQGSPAGYALGGLVVAGIVGLV
jgi:hypothetical protein